MGYLDATPEERDAWMAAYIERRKAEGYDRRLPRYNGKGRGRAPKGTLSPHSSLKKMARNAWRKRVRRAEERRANEGLQENPGQVQTTS